MTRRPAAAVAFRFRECARRRRCLDFLERCQRGLTIGCDRGIVVRARRFGSGATAPSVEKSLGRAGPTAQKPLGQLAQYEGTLDLVMIHSLTESEIDDWKSYYQVIDADTFQSKFYPLLLMCLNPSLEE